MKFKRKSIRAIFATLCFSVFALGSARHWGPGSTEVGLFTPASASSEETSMSDKLQIEDQIKGEIQPRVGEFKKALVTKLQEGLKKSPEEAVKVCHLEAPKIAKAKTTKQFKIGRTSFKLRNPNNKAPEWTLPFLQKFKNSNASSAMPPEVISLSNGRWGYAEPLYTQALCLTCHGSQVETKLSDVIRAKYPKDQATGYKLGDFRGLVWVEYKR